jgi:hypothetical protein
LLLPSRYTGRNFPAAPKKKLVRRRHATATVAGRYAGPESAYRLAFTDTEFLLREELRPVRMQLELLKPEMVQPSRASSRPSSSSAARASCRPRTPCCAGSRRAPAATPAAVAAPRWP